MYITYILKNFTEEQYDKIKSLKDLKNIIGLVSYEIITDSKLIEKLENNKKNYGAYFI